MVVEEQEFCESKAANEQHTGAQQMNRPAAGGYGEYSRDASTHRAPSVGADGFMHIPEGIDEELPFS